ncbi:MAG: MBL fold metallo-hydrolase [Fimbriimonadaceae bacterium]|nr:MBL fold metallo-hydrolase [Fimbriimonadaceae bacterium]
MSQSITFLGAAQTVTGSRHMLRLGNKNVLIDCGLFQGGRELRDRNWQPFPFAPADIDQIILTHAHNDHIGYLPRLVANGYRGKIFATPGTIALCRIALPDSGRIQEEDARFANKHGYTNHKPALPLYTEKDAYEALKLMEPVHYYESRDIGGGYNWRYMPAGHILGSAFVEMYFPNGERILMSGDLGRYNTPIITDPTKVDFSEYLVIESTYGDRRHPTDKAEDILERVLREAWETGGTVIVPSFAIGRTQDLLYNIHCLQLEGRLPRIPVFIDSPMAASTTEVYRRIKEDHDSDMRLAIKEGEDPLQPDYLEYIRDASQSKALNSRRGPMVIISGSGMASGGRVVHHLKHRLGDPSTIVLFTGFQAMGTLGRKIVDGNEVVEIHGMEVPVRAKIEKIGSLSAHADYQEMLDWLANFKTPPKMTFLVHGEPPAQEALQEKIESQLGWKTMIPAQGDSFELI